MWKQRGGVPIKGETGTAILWLAKGHWPEHSGGEPNPLGQRRFRGDGGRQKLESPGGQLHNTLP